MEIENKKLINDIIFSVLFVSGDGIEKEFIAEKLNLKIEDVDKAIADLQKIYSGDNGVHLITYKNKVQLASNPAYADYIGTVLNPIREKTLTKAALETLAIIAYKQPVTKLEIEEIRGVNNADYAIQILLDQNVIEVVGRKDAVGKPLLFGTSEGFLKRFNLKDLAELPDYESLIDRISIIETRDEQLQGEGLYREYSIPEEETLPDYLQGEDVQTVTADDSETKNVEEEFENELEEYEDDDDEE